VTDCAQTHGQCYAGFFAEDDHTSQRAPLAGGKVRARVQRAAVVPHQDIAPAPGMLIEESRLLLVIEQLL